MPYRDKHNFAFLSLNRCREGPLRPRLELTLEKGAVVELQWCNQLAYGTYKKGVVEILGSVTTARDKSASLVQTDAPISKQGTGLAPHLAISRV